MTKVATTKDIVLRVPKGIIDMAALAMTEGKNAPDKRQHADGYFDDACIVMTSILVENFAQIIKRSPDGASSLIMALTAARKGQHENAQMLTGGQGSKTVDHVPSPDEPPSALRELIAAFSK